MDFPFPLSGSVPTAPRGDCVIDVCATTPRPKGLVATDEVVKLFAVAVNRQLFSPAPLRSRMDLVHESVSTDGLRKRYAFATEGVAPTAFRALLSLLAQTHHAGDALASLQIVGPAPGDGRVVELQELLAPGIVAAQRPLTLPFSLNRRFEEAEPGFLSITVEFGSRLRHAQFVVVRESFNVWDHLTMLGAFKADFAEQEDFSESYGQTAHMAPMTVEHATPAYDGTLAGLNAALNMLCAVHAEVAPIESVEIE